MVVPHPALPNGEEPSKKAGERRQDNAVARRGWKEPLGVRRDPKIVKRRHIRMTYAKMKWRTCAVTSEVVSNTSIYAVCPF